MSNESSVLSKAARELFVENGNEIWEEDGKTYMRQPDGVVIQLVSSIDIADKAYEMIQVQEDEASSVRSLQQNPLNHGSFKDLIDDPETLAWYAESQKGYTPVEEVQVETTDELLTWALEHRETDVAHTEYVSHDADECLPIDDPRQRTIGFFTPEKGVFITLTDLRKSPPSAEVLAKFGPVPVEVLKEAQADPIKLVCSYAGRYWLATGRVFRPGCKEDLPDSTLLDEIWAAEAEQFKMKDEGDLGIPRPLKDR